MRRLLPAFLLLPLAGPRAQEPVMELPEVVVQSRRFEEARSRIAPSLGASVTEITREAIERLPQGEETPLNQVLLQAPGVVQAPQGELHVRGDHRNLQYRINGVTIPEAISGFGQLFDARGLRSVSLITGALPAQFGYRTAGVVDIRLRSGAQEPGGTASLYGGSFGTFQPGLSYGGGSGRFEYFLSGSMLRSDRGFENPTAARTVPRNATEQFRGLLNAAYALDDRTRLALIAGGNASRFEVPMVAGGSSPFTAFGRSSFDGLDPRARQWQRTGFGVLALQHSRDALDVQISGFLRRSTVSYLPDVLADLLGTGVASSVGRRNTAIGLQGDAAWRVAERHTLRAGFFLSRDETANRLASTVLPLDVSGGTLDAPFTITERDRVTQSLGGLYLQDEWRPLERVTVNFGARLDGVRGPASGSQLSPRLNVVWNVSDATTLSAGYARYFTPPPAELLARPDLARYAGTTLEPEVARAGAVRPERAHYFNLGLRHRIGERLTLGAEAFWRDVRDLQDLGQFGTAYVFSPYNYARGRVYGTELTAAWRGERWSFHGNVTLSRSEGKGLVSNQYFWSAAELAQVARKFVRTDHDQAVSASAGASWRAWEGGTLSATLLYGSGMRRGFANSESVTPYVTMNLGVAHRFEGPDGGRWTARLDVLNVFDRRYQLRDGTGIGVGAPQFGLRRGIFAGLSRSF
ncbi:TonB-dependent receptor [Sabulicella glaciei]|uniref:TonB-dependent receptor n=1 Tax=Sabulicella glaciei TaxID=2984948 RepID=A0ABT3NX65_9PROT|nr:TonB-dependent receptor [Roseococcus sp. MDT2-1-1]MCW8086755.1 TonB-dependent receptor [Roseococcus sp. MDT2-1-1]